MTYATIDDIKARFGEEDLVYLTDRDGDGVIDQTAVDAALADAQATIDGYLRARYALPLDTVPDLLRRIAAVLAWWNLHGGRAPEDVDALKADVEAKLDKVAKGRIAIDTGEGSGAPASDGIRFEGPERVFTRESLDGL